MLGCEHTRSHQDAGPGQFPLSVLPSCDRQVCTKLIPSLSFLQTSIPPTTSRPPILDLGLLSFSYLHIGKSPWRCKGALVPLQTFSKPGFSIVSLQSLVLTSVEGGVMVGLRVPL